MASYICHFPVFLFCPNQRPLDSLVLIFYLTNRIVTLISKINSRLLSETQLSNIIEFRSVFLIDKMQIQQTYSPQVKLLLKQEPTLKLEQALSKLLNGSIDEQTIHQKLLDYQQQNKDKQISSSNKQHIGLIEVRQCQQSQIYDIIGFCLNNHYQDDEQIQQQKEDHLQSNQIDKQQNQRQEKNGQSQKSDNQNQQQDNRLNQKKQEDDKNIAQQVNQFDEENIDEDDNNSQQFPVAFRRQSNKIQTIQIDNAKQIMANQLARKLVDQSNQFQRQNQRLKTDQTVQLQLNDQQLKKKYEKTHQKVQKYVQAAYHQYSKQTFKELESFESNVDRKNLIDMRIFMKYFKDFELADIMKATQITYLFKKHAINGVKLDLNKFNQLHKILIFGQEEPKDIQKQEVKINKEILKQQINKMKLFLKHFTRQRVKKCLQINNKAALEKIISEHHQKQKQVPILEDKGEVIDKFLKRNFDYEVERWYQKKEINHQKLKKNPKLSRISIGNDKMRDQQSISDSIKKLQSRSEKNLSHLKSLLNDDFDVEEARFFRQKKQRSQHVQNQLETHRKALHKNIKKNVASIYDQLGQYDLKDIKQSKKILKSHLEIEQHNQLLLDAPPIKKTQKLSNNKSEKQLMLRKVKQNLNSSKSVNALPKLSKSKQIVKKINHQKKQNHIGSLSKINYVLDGLQLQYDNQFLQNLNKQKLIRPKNHSSPSHSIPSKQLQKPVRKRYNSHKKIKSPKQIHQQVYDVINIFERGGHNHKKLNKSHNNKQQNLIKVKLNKIGENHNLPNPNLKRGLVQNENLNKKYIHANLLSKKQSKRVKGDMKNPQNNDLLSNYHNQVYELFKYFKNREKDQQKIVALGKSERKGYLVKNSKNKIIQQNLKRHIK